MLSRSSWLSLGAAGIACGADPAPVPVTTCAEAPYPEGGMADLQFTGVREIAEQSSIALSDYFDPCAPAAHLLWLRVVAGWCGTCRWQAAHTEEVLDPAFAGRLDLVDVVIANDDNVPAQLGDLASFRKWIVADGTRTLVADPTFQLRSVLPPRMTLPASILIDTRTMTVVDVATETDATRLKDRIASAFAKLDGTTPPLPTPVTLKDGRFAAREVDMMQGMVTPGPPPPDDSNAQADDPNAAALGESLFSDTGFSANGKVACVTCHAPAKAYSDGLPVSMGLGSTNRNAPSITLAAHSRWEFWDGRADSLWSQALGPIEAPNEIGSSRLRVVHWLASHYAAPYQVAFGPLPSLADASRFPPDGKPGDPSWEAMAKADQDTVNRVFSNAGKAIEAHERKLRVQPNAVDRYVAGDGQALTDAQKDGLHAFFTIGCAQCHYGPRLTDDAFHALDFPTGRADMMPDRGRIDGVVSLLASEFDRGGAYSDSKTPVVVMSDPSMLGAFKTPTLRGLPLTAPYGHGGTFATLDDLLAVYAMGGNPKEPTATGTLEPWLVSFDAPTSSAVLELMKVLGGDPQN